MTGKLFDAPLQGIVLRDIVRVTSRRVEGGTLHIFGDGHKDVNIVGNTPLLVIALDFNDEADPGGGGGFNNHIN